MIAIQSENGELIKVLKNVLEGEFGFHRSFGIISKDLADQRVQTRRRQFYDYTNNEWLCSFKIITQDQTLKILALSGCEAKALAAGWELKTPMGVFNISDVLNGKISPLIEEYPDKNKWLSSALVLILLLNFLFL
jgi:hypothetical protein